jgi:putative GTP pyrophosphokinase
MGQDALQQIVVEYHDRFRVHEAFGSTVQRLISDLLNSAQIKFHSVSYRTKTEVSLREKLAQPGSKYATLSDVTDTCGVRFITYFSDEVDKVAALVEREFSIDRENSVDKRKALDPDRFGYLSVHYILRLTPERSNLGEYATFRDCIAEVQIRSILQHAWAEIEHDLGYKSKSGVPRDMRRQFSRLAGLLEIADDGFAALRQNLNSYSEEVSEKIADRADELLIDSVSLKALIDSDGTVKEYDELVRGLADGPEAEPNALDRLASGALGLGFRTIGDLKTAMLRDRVRWRRFLVAFWTARQSGAAIPDGISVFYFTLLEALQKGGRDLVLKLYFPSLPLSDADAVPFFHELQRAYDAVSGS